MSNLSDEDEEYEENKGNRLFGFMFGNVDNSGDLEADYLDEDAKEHLSALADKLGQSLTDIDLLGKSPHTPADGAEPDYDEKAENAVNYEDIDEEYDGPEVHAASEEDYLLPKRDYFSSEVSQDALKRNSVFDDENYDEDEECEEDNEVEKESETQEVAPVVSQGVTSHVYDREPSRLEPKQLEVAEEIQEEVNELLGSPPNDTTPTLPILYTDGGMVILRFSEIFGIQEPLQIERKRDHGYFKYKERYKSTDVKGLVEEDEEAFLNSYGEGFRFVKQDGIAQQKYLSLNNDINIGVRDASSMPVDLSEPIEDPFISGKPLKNDMIDNVSVGWSSHVSPHVFPLDQHDWEKNILWDTSPAKSDNSRESLELFGHDSEGLAVKGSDAESRQQSLQATSAELNQTKFVHGSPVLLESFGSRDPFLPTGGPIFGNQLHSQLLRLEFQSEAVDPNQGNVAENLLEPNQSDAVRRFSKLTLENSDSMEDSWSNDIIWDTDTPITRPKLILDLQDEHMLFEILDQDSKDLQLHAGAMIISRSLKPNTRGSFENQNRKSPCSWQFNIANDKFYMNGKSSQQLQANSNKRNIHSFRIHHSIPALKLQTIKLKLSNKDIANFHRPKGLWYPHDNEVAVKEQGKLPTKGPMKVIIKSLGGKGRTLHVNSEESVSSVKAKASRKLDFKPTEMVKLFYLGKELEDNKSLAAQTVQPNSLVHLVRTELHLWPCAQKLPGENKALRPPGAFKKKSELSVKDGHVVLVEYCEERPLLLSNAGMGANLCTYYQKSSPGDQRNNMESNENKSWGSTLILEPGDKSPFLGDIRAGCSQSSLETNMYKAPIFPHKVQSTDYLLVRSTKGKLSIRRIDRVAAVGQQEPLMEIMTPGSKNLQTYMVNRMLVYVYREFVRSGLRRPIAADELSFLFSNLSEAIIKKNLRACAFPRRDKNGQLCWFMRHDFHSPPENELRKMVAPEHVCSYESMQAGLYRLKHLGITRLTLPASISSAMTQLPNVAIDLAAASHIERALQITPWNLSNNFVACTNQDRVNIERLEITGVGDPSGRGLGFSYVRAVPKAPISGGQTKKKVAAARGPSTVTGTDADLRRLSMEAAREVLLKFNVPEEQIAKQTRWHRIANIRQLSSDQAASGVKVDPTTISKYARGQRMSFLQLQQQTREKCQEIWDWQVQSLSAFDCDENDGESEANSDLDSFAGDLENLLYAEEEEGDEGDNLCQNEILDGVKGIKMRRRPSQVPVEEEFEDEAAEATELCRLLMDDADEQKKKKKKKVTPMVREEGFVPGPRSNGTVKIAEHVKKLTPGAKKTINITQPDWSGAKNEKISRDPINVQNLSIKRNISGKEKTNKENGTLSVGQPKKVIILGDQLLMYKEKKSARERFVCGACGQFGHMRTNKNCPKYGEPIETQLETTEIEKSAGKYNTLDQPGLSQTKLMKKKAVPKSATKIRVVEAPEGETSSSKTKVLPLKFRYGRGDKLSSSEATGSSNQAAMTDLEPRANSVVKISKIKISNKVKPEVQVESDKVTLTKGPPEYTDRGQSENYNMPSASLQLALSIKKEQVGTYKHTVAIPPTTNIDHQPHIVILPPTEKERDQPQKKIIIKCSKEKTDQDQISLDGSPLFEHRKTKRMADLAGLQRNRKQESLRFIEESSEQRVSEDRSWWEEEETRRITERHREERVMNSYRGQSRGLEEVERFDELKRYEEAIRREREEEELRKATKKKKRRKKQPEIMDDYMDGYHTRRTDKRMPERDRSAKRRAVAELGCFGAEHAPPTKRRRGGEVGLSNILEGIVETLRENTEVSFLFLKPVSKKEALDYLNIIEDPMDLSTIRDKARRMEYKGREDFRHDVWLITYNAHKYNDGRNPQIPPLADQLLEHCDYLLELNCESLREAEASIRSKDH